MALKKISTPAAALPYFRPEALTFLRNLAKHNDREWFQPRKAQFEAELKEPMLAIMRKVTDAMLDFAPNHVRPAEKSLFRIYRDTRFSNDKRPYKTHVAAWWSHQGLEKTSGAGYYFHVSAKEVVIAAGAYMPEKDQLAAIRHWLLDNHAEFRKLLQRAAVRKHFDEFEGNALTRPPKGFPADHPAIDLIQCRQWGLCGHAASKGCPRRRICRHNHPLFQPGRAHGGCAQHARSPRPSCLKSRCSSGCAKRFFLQLSSRPLALKASKNGQNQLILGKNGTKWHKNLRKLWKIAVFPLTLSAPKPHCYERQGSREPA